jgi:hypothetical protein
MTTFDCQATFRGRHSLLRHSHALPLLALAAVVSGCSSSDDGRMKVYPVSGKVTVGGQPAAGAQVVFYGATPELTGPGTVAPAGTTDENGAFTLRSYEAGDGAPAGKFKVTVIWPEPTPEGAGEMFQAKDRLNGQYDSPDKSNLTVDVPEGGGELPPIALN